MANIVRISKEDAQRRLADVPLEHVFRCHDGRQLRNMRELEQAFSSMDEETFVYHSNSEKKDFSNWVNDIIGDDKLARDLAKVQGPTRASKAVGDRVAFLTTKLS